MKKWGSLVGFVVLAQIVGGSSGFVTAKSIKDGWYDGLDKPQWTPPNAVFGPVWTILFACMGIAAWRVWRRREENPDETRRVLALWGLQLGLNAGWSLAFFGLRRPRLALAEIIALWSSVALSTRAFWKRDKFAGSLFVPYLLWTSFAVLLNASIARRNEN